eukprot:COSAG01_NODE_8991_length_2589_cov_8.795181_4_plen_79_part_00
MALCWYWASPWLSIGFRMGELPTSPEVLITRLRTWLDTPEHRRKLRLDAAADYRQQLADRDRRPDTWGGWFPVWWCSP